MFLRNYGSGSGYSGALGIAKRMGGGELYVSGLEHGDRLARGQERMDLGRRERLPVVRHSIRHDYWILFPSTGVGQIVKRSASRGCDSLGTEGAGGVNVS
jgi:hypothetical protein